MPSRRSVPSMSKRISRTEVRARTGSSVRADANRIATPAEHDGARVEPVPAPARLGLVAKASHEEGTVSPRLHARHGVAGHVVSVGRPFPKVPLHALQLPLRSIPPRGVADSLVLPRDQVRRPEIGARVAAV